MSWGASLAACPGMLFWLLCRRFQHLPFDALDVKNSQWYEDVTAFRSTARDLEVRQQLLLSGCLPKDIRAAWLGVRPAIALHLPSGDPFPCCSTNMPLAGHPPAAAVAWQHHWRRV